MPIFRQITIIYLSFPMKRIFSVDILRALAIFFVVAVHIPNEAPGGWRQHPFFFFSFIFDFGELGVPMFVLISGFCVHLRASATKKALGKYDIDWKFFWKKSFYRVYIPYLFAILFSLICAFFFHSRYSFTNNSFWLDLASHIFLFHNITTEYSVGLGNGALWFLGMEAQIYLLYPILILLICKTSYKITVITVITLTIVWRIYSQYFYDLSFNLFSFAIGDWSKWAFYYWGVWLLGAFSAEAYHNNLKLPKWIHSFTITLVCGTVGILLSKNTFELLSNTSFGDLVSLAPVNAKTFFHLLSGFLFIISFVCFLNWSVNKEAKTGNVFFFNLKKIPIFSFIISELSRKSYSIYLVHVPIILTLDQLFDIGFEPVGWLIRQVVYWITIICVSSIFFTLVEKPSLSFAGKLKTLKAG